MSKTMWRIAKCADASEPFATLTHDECVLLAALHVKASELCKRLDALPKLDLATWMAVQSLGSALGELNDD